MSVQYEGDKKRLRAASLYILAFSHLKKVVKLYAAKEMATGEEKDLSSISARGIRNWISDLLFTWKSWKNGVVHT